MGVLQEYVIAVNMSICLCIGYIIKNIEFIDNRYIPLIMGIVGVIINVWRCNWLFTPDILLGGLASGLASTGIFEVVRNASNKQS